MLGRRDREGLGVQPVKTGLLDENLLHHVRRGASGHVFVEKDHPVGLLERFEHDARAVERQKRPDVDQLAVDPDPRQKVGGFPGDSTESAWDPTLSCRYHLV